MNKLLIALTAAVLPFAVQAKPLSDAQARQIIAPLYKNFTVPQGDVAVNVKSGTTSDWQSCASATDCRGQDLSIKVFGGFGQMIPDMRHSISQVVVSGDTIVVRGELSGTPAGDFFGVPHTGRSFKIMTMDMHTVKNGKLQKTYHIEDWAGALQQLRSK
ncbi:MAG: ester cyclase [Formosimonas sp.]